MVRRPVDIIGWREWVALPALGCEAIKAKVDTGARSSSLHAFDLELYVAEDGGQRVRFEIHPLQRSRRSAIEVDAPVAETRVVRNPGGGGREELRPVIVTPVRLRGEAWPIELTLTRRDAMGFRMLLGRQAIRGRFLVDPGRSFTAGRYPGGTS